MSYPRDDRRTKAKDVPQHPQVSFPSADPDTPSVVNFRTVSLASTLPGFGTAHPDAANYPNCFLVDRNSSRGDNTDANLTLEYHTLPGTLLIGTQAGEFDLMTVSKRAEKTGSITAPVGPTVADSAVTAENAVESELTETTYSAVPTPFWIQSYEIDQDTNVGVYVRKRINVNGTIGGISSSPTVTILSATIAANTIINFSGIKIRNGETIQISGDTNTTPSINGIFSATLIDSTHLSVPVNVTSVAGSGFGQLGLYAPVYTEIQPLNFRQCIEIQSQVDTTTLPATRTWTDYIDYPWKEVLVGLDAFSDAGVDSSSLAGTFPVPTQLTWMFGANIDNDCAIRTVRYTGKTFVSITRTYSIGAPTPDSVLQIRTSSGELMMTSIANSQHVALSIGTSTTGTQTSVSQSFKHKTARIEDVLTGSFSTGTIGTGIVLKLDASSPANFTAGATFIGSSDVTPGRLSLFMKETIVITVPTPWPN